MCLSIRFLSFWPVNNDKNRFEPAEKNIIALFWMGFVFNNLCSIFLAFQTYNIWWYWPQRSPCSSHKTGSNFYDILLIIFLYEKQPEKKDYIKSVTRTFLVNKNKFLLNCLEFLELTLSSSWFQLIYNFLIA